MSVSFLIFFVRRLLIGNFYCPVLAYTCVARLFMAVGYLLPGLLHFYSSFVLIFLLTSC
jgi:hypothetical protein